MTRDEEIEWRLGLGKPGPVEKIGPLLKSGITKDGYGPPVLNLERYCGCKYALSQVMQAEPDAPLPEPSKIRLWKGHVIMNDGTRAPIYAGQCHSCGRILWHEDVPVTIDEAAARN
jgi:hypothetical protein